MADRFPARGLNPAPLLLALALAACVGIGADPAPPDTPEAALDAQAQALQRTVQEAAVAGATAGAGGVYLFGGKGPATALGLFGGIPIGVATGTYVGYLQQQYATNEARLDRLRADLDATNAETAAAIATMRSVLARESARLAAARAAGTVDPTARSSLAAMNRAIDGAEGRRAEFEATRALRLGPGEETGVDPRIATLGQHIADMRAIAAQLASQL
ncbi:hypothetical protein [Amaricoccus solimangrovi]|uniref:Lipoprotein n=1 Tax=Amaricoccus solimangrovi TaxID=2589815 RepID=A0A501WAZ7_9RHOB|nr:hypothetical protein [Amaricoccus solimangrovi]TPE46578.1 hypothetical protein FJM51_21815 [Amaricoccus solimangrovi]